MIIGVIKEGKIPPDRRVPLTPEKALTVKDQFGCELIVQTSDIRCYSDEEYKEKGFKIFQDLIKAEVIMGIKEVPVSMLIPKKTYMFFSHTIKKQPYNRNLLLKILERNIRLIDYEMLKNDKGQRVIAFGKFAGMVGAHNAIWTYAKRNKLFDLPRMMDIFSYNDAKEIYKTLDIPPVKIIVTGKGRVGAGAALTLTDMGIKRVSVEDFLKEQFDYPVFTQIDADTYTLPKDKNQEFSFPHFFANPEKYKNNFKPFTQVADIMVNCIYWDPKAPAFFTKEEMRSPSFKIKTISDVTCDIAPKASIPSTLRATKISDPVFGYDCKNECETKPFDGSCIDVMSIDNLPAEMPREASDAFGEMFIEEVLPELLKEESKMIDNATIAKDGKLTPPFEYLQDYVDGTNL
jgi:alanine dehydrogenase